MLFLESSAKTKEGIRQVFSELVEKVLENPALLANTAPGRPKGTVNPTLAAAAQDQASGGYCC